MLPNKPHKRSSNAKPGSRAAFDIVANSSPELMLKALDYSVNCFKRHAMSMTTDQMLDNINDILTGAKHWSCDTKQLVCDFVDREEAPYSRRE